MKRTDYIQVIVCVICLSLGLLLIFRKPDQIFYTKPIKVIEKEIAGKKEQLKTITEHRELVRNEVTYYRTIFDTVNLVRYQDSLITVQDTQIVVLEQIVGKQDTVIDVLKFDNKRLKRQRNISFIANAVLAGLLILK